MSSQNVLNILQTALERALCSYELFVESHMPDPQNPKSFEEFHKACKAGLTHIELLKKLIAAEENTFERETTSTSQVPLLLMQQSAQQIMDDETRHPVEQDI